MIRKAIYFWFWCLPVFSVSSCLSPIHFLFHTEHKVSPWKPSKNDVGPQLQPTSKHLDISAVNNAGHEQGLTKGWCLLSISSLFPASYQMALRGGRVGERQARRLGSQAERSVTLRMVQAQSQHLKNDTCFHRASLEPLWPCSSPAIS